jgi:hypothetical protein
MKFTAFLLCLSMLLTGALINAAIAKDIDPAKQCIRGAAKDYQECRQQCQADFKEAKEVCRDVAHSCALDCTEKLDKCEEIPLTKLENCKNGCNLLLDAAKENCRSHYGKGSEELDACIDQAQVIAFLCRDGCREDVSDELKPCRLAFRNCISACQPPQTTTHE